MSEPDYVIIIDLSYNYKPRCINFYLDDKCTGIFCVFLIWSCYECGTLI